MDIQQRILIYHLLEFVIRVPVKLLDDLSLLVELVPLE